MSQDKLRVALLRDLEWCLDIEGRCPSCMQYEANGHAPDCRLAKVLKDDPTPAGPGLREAVALALWHRFAPAHHIDWKDEPHRAEYLDAADGVLALALQSEVAGERLSAFECARRSLNWSVEMAQAAERGDCLPYQGARWAAAFNAAELALRDPAPASEGRRDHG